MSPNTPNNEPSMVVDSPEVIKAKEKEFNRMLEVMRRRNHKHQSGSRKTGGFGKPKNKRKGAK